MHDVIKGGSNTDHVVFFILARK